MCHLIQVYHHKLLGVPYFTYTLFTPLILTATQKKKKWHNFTGSYYFLLNFNETFTFVCSNVNQYLGAKLIVGTLMLFCISSIT